ncbi:unnamed protein product [Albugo candida]|nr:unnamed protein product [Albugo candida]|eukprot:CCI48783.1 unnamed protein product [Albugo candida]
MGILSVQTPFVRRTTGNALIKTSKRLLTKVYEHHDSSVPKKNRLPTNLRENDIMTISNFNVVNTSSLLPTRSDATQCVNEIDALLYTLKANDIVEVQFNASWYPGMIMECNLDDSYSVMWWMDDNSQRFSRQLLNKQLRIPLFTLQNSRTSNTYIDHLWQLASDLAGYLFQKQSIINLIVSQITQTRGTLETMRMDPMQTNQSSQASPRSRQIVSINEDGTRFTLDEKALEEIFHQVPEDMKVAIYSVVGAFRTGKSFLLDLFLRYLRFGSDGPILSDTVNTKSDEWKKWIYSGVDSMKSGKSMLEGNSNFELTNGSKGFSWRAGRKRNTTGIWMWEQAFIRKTESGEDVAVFLVDTQGMFDSETSQMLTASIFGLSTLLSSYQIYNVDKRVQEDNMQHLALFSEYGRMALFGHDETNRNIQALDSRCLSIRKTHSNVSTNEENAATQPEDIKKKGSRPFQKLDFLVRDWQDFSRKQSLAEKRKDMVQYTNEILSIRTQKDLANTREQIFSCFETVTCFLLPHPGHEVTEPEYDGNVEAIDDRFLELVTVYLDDIFSPAKLAPKYVHGVPVTSRELLTFIRYYAALFRDSSIFPEAKTLLEATAEANNVNKREKAILKYKKEMESLVGLKSGYVPVAQLEKHHAVCSDGAMAVFDQGANMGRQSQIRAHRSTLAAELAKEYERFSSVNAERDPYKNLEFYLIPGAIAFALLAFRVGQDLFCYEHVGYDLPLYDCKHVSKTLTHLYWAIFIFMLLITFSTGQVMFARIKTILSLIKTASQAEGKAKSD